MPPGQGYAGPAAKKKKKENTYIPPPKSGAYAILVALYMAETNEHLMTLNKEQLQDYAQNYCSSSMTKSKPNSFYTAWSSIKTLLDKGLVDRQISKNSVYSLTYHGRDLAKKLVEFQEVTQQEGTNNKDRSLGNNREPKACNPSKGSSRFEYLDQMYKERANMLDDADSKGSRISNQPPPPVTISDSDAIFFASDDESNSNAICDPIACSNNAGGSFTLKAGAYDIYLIVDQREKIEILRKEGINVEKRVLACGDYLWVARPKGSQSNNRTRDLVLDIVVERKRLDDLASSIKDGRFEEQKHRLRTCGIRRPTYLIEDYGRAKNCRLNPAALAQATTNMEVIDGLDVEYCKSADAVTDFFVRMTKTLEKFHRHDDLVACSPQHLSSGLARYNEFMTFANFQANGAKMHNWTIKEMFAKNLMQIRGMSAQKVSEIVTHYPTLQDLLDAYEICTSERDKEEMLSCLKSDTGRNFGSALSKKVYACYSRKLALEIQSDLMV